MKSGKIEENKYVTYVCELLEHVLYPSIGLEQRDLPTVMSLRRLCAKFAYDLKLSVKQRSFIHYLSYKYLGK